MGNKERSEQQDKLLTFAKVGARPSENPKNLVPPVRYYGYIVDRHNPESYWEIRKDRNCQREKSFGGKAIY